MKASEYKVFMWSKFLFLSLKFPSAYPSLVMSFLELIPGARYLGIKVLELLWKRDGFIWL